MASAPATIAADVVAKCIAKGTIGGTYVPVPIARAAWPPEDRALFPEALSLLGARGFLKWHKLGACFSLEPTCLAQAYAYALEHASPKRRATLQARGPPDRAAWQRADQDLPETVQDQEAWEEPWVADLKAFPTRAEVASLLAGVREDLARATQREAGEGAALAKEVLGLREEVNRLKSEAGRLGALEAQVREQQEVIAGLRADHQTWAQVIAQMETIIKADKERQARLALADKLRGLTCPCGKPAVALVPSYKAIGVRWKRADDIAVCQEDKEKHHVCLEWPDDRSATNRGIVDRLLRTVPDLGGLPPFVGCDTPAQAKAIREGLLRHGIVTTEQVRVYDAPNPEA